MASPAQPPSAPVQHERDGLRQDARRRAVAFVLVFVAAFGVRLLCWRDVRFEAYKVQTSVVENYKHMARLLSENGAASFYDPDSPTSEPDLLGHPPGYPFVLAAVYRLFGESDAAVQVLQAACDALAAALLFLIAAELLTFGVGVVAGALFAVAPLTLRNAVVFGHFIPVSLGAGQTLIEGIGDYDPAGRFGLPATDVELQRQEAETYGHPEYATSLFGPDAIERDRARRARAFGVIRAHPLWFAGVMARRASSMLRLERTPLASTLPVSDGWARAPRLAVRAAQKLFITALFLPLQLFGLAALVRARQWRAQAALLSVPLYYLCVQSALHTEYRYVLVVQYFLLVPAALALRQAGIWVWEKWSERRG